MSSRRSRIALLASAAAIGGALWVLGVRANGDDMAETFDAEVWRDEERIYTDPFPRLAMAEALVEGGLPEGMSREAVIDLLGPPTDTPYFADRDLVYWLSESQRGLGVDSHWLVIDFDASGLSAAEIVRD